MKTITSDDILGKVALDTSGDELGIVTELHIDKENKTITGVTIDQGFMKPSLFIGIKHILKFGIDSVMLNKVPYEKIKGLNVLDERGELFGYVDEVIVKKYKIDSIIVSKTKVSSKKYIITGKDIDKISSDVLLKKGFKAKLKE
ncbi:MAG: hypothetical protein PHU51_01705 [Candidatus Nanoarchaeia archaeon]|nr:hypothetical protein [Candidatus Nanoarchaeia archaeon]